MRRKRNGRKRLKLGVARPEQEKTEKTETGLGSLGSLLLKSYHQTHEHSPGKPFTRLVLSDLVYSWKAAAQCVVLALLVHSTRAASIEGEITFTLSKPTARAAFTREFGDDLKVKCDWKVLNLSGKETLFAGASVKNTGSSTLWFLYSVAFFDKDKKLVGAASTPLFVPEGLEPGKTWHLPCIVYLPQGKYKDIAMYQAVLYELDEPIIRGKKKPIQLEDPETIAPEIRTNVSPKPRP